MIYIKKFKKNILLKVLKGYKKLNNLGKLESAHLLNERLAEVRCINNGVFYKFIFGATYNLAEITIRQFLLSKLMGLRLVRAILYSNGLSNKNLIYPLPLSWINIPSEFNIDVDKRKSRFAWIFITIIFFLIGLIKISQILQLGIFNIIKSKSKKLGRYVMFIGLSKNNIPNQINHSKDNIISWYSEWSGRSENVKSFCHTVRTSQPIYFNNVSVFSLDSELPKLSGINELLDFLLWSMAAASLSLFDLIRGRWWHAVILSEASKAKVVRIKDKKALAEEYLFHNSAPIYRPLWTYEAESKKSRITFYFYSTNCEAFEGKEHLSRRVYYGYKTMTWPNYLVWDSYQAKFISKVAKFNPKIEVVGPILFSSSVQDVWQFKKPYIAVFDVQPVRPSLYRTYGIEFDFYTPETVNKFILDIYEILKGRNLNMAHKQKRDISSRLHRSYKSLINQLVMLPNYTEIDPDLAAKSIVENALAVISLPFTSTAIIAKEGNKPTAYYDPNSALKKDDIAAHGVQILQGRKELEDWINALSKGINS